jgi:hypothetical protein
MIATIMAEVGTYPHGGCACPVSGVTTVVAFEPGVGGEDALASLASVVPAESIDRLRCGKPR